jgi:glycine betaine/proline transport system substrate-binding protein
MQKFLVMVIMVLIIMPVTVFSAGQQDGDVQTIVFADVSWDSVQVHNRIVAFIMENGFDGYKADYMPGDTLPLANGLVQGDIDVNMESWHSN